MLKRYGVALVALLSLMAGMTDIAQASPHYRIAGVPVVAPESVTGGGIVLLNIPKSEAKVLCKTQKVERTIMQKGQSTGLLQFSVCSVTGAPCQVTEAFNFEVKTHLIEHQGKMYEVFEPATGTTFTTLSFTGAECALPSKAEVKGSFAALVQGEGTANYLSFHKSIDELVCSIITPCGLKINEDKTSLQGTSAQILSGANKGKNWQASSVVEFYVEEEPLAAIGTETIALSGGSVVFDMTSYYYSIPKIHCQGVSGTGTIEGMAKANVTLNFEDCTLIGYFEQKRFFECEVKAMSTELQISVVTTAENGRIWLLTDKEGGNAFFTFTIGPPWGFCFPLPGEYAIQGKEAAPAEEGESFGHSLTFSPEFSELFPEYGLQFGSYPVPLTGGLSMWLTGPHEGDEWGFN